MNGIVITWPQLLVAAVLVVGVYAAELLLFWRKSATRRPGAATPDTSQREEVRKLRAEVQALREDLTRLSSRADAMASQAAADAEADSPYSQAIRLARQGLDSQAVASGCGISRGEAELIVALYRSTGRP